LAHRKLLLEREALQARIRSEAEWLETLIANTGDAILAAESHGMLTVVNPAAVCLLGETAQIGQPASACLPYSLASMVSNWLEVGSLSPVVMEAAWVDGSTQMVNLAPVMDKENTMKGWVMVLRDISLLKNADEYRLKVISEVVQRIQLPLVHAVNTLAELNQMGRQDDRIARAVYRLSNIWGSIKDWVDDLAELVKKEEKVELRQVDINIVPMLVQLQSNLGIRLREGGHRLVLGTLPNLPIVRTDPSLLSQLLEGLIERSAQRSTSGGNIHVNARAPGKGLD
jgi:signal transduction histidine kinase